MSDLFINKRKRNLEKFLNWLALNPIIKNSKLFYDFLSIESEEELNKAKLEYQKAPKPLNLIEFYHKDGKMNLELNKEKEEYLKRISKNNTNGEILLSNLNVSLKQLKLQFDILIQKMEEVQQNWEVLYVYRTRNFEDKNMQNTYDKMNKLFTNWVDSLKKQNDLLYVDIREYFKYVKNNFREMKTNILNVEYAKGHYYNFEKFLIWRKEELYKRGDPTKWELDPNEKAKANILAKDKLSALFKMCAEDTDRCIQRKIYYGYHLNQLIEDYERMRDFNGIMHKENQMTNCKRLSEIINEFQKHIEESFSDSVVKEIKINE